MGSGMACAIPGEGAVDQANGARREARERIAQTEERLRLRGGIAPAGGMGGHCPI